MLIKLNRPFSSSASVDEQDVRSMKRVLNRLGYYTPPEDFGSTHIPDRAVFEALKKFQKDRGIFANGTAKPDDPTLAAMNAAIQTQEQDPDAGYIWRTQKDGKVRRAHAAREGKKFYWSNPPEGGHPGEDFGCRCWAENIKQPHKVIIDPPIRPVYPELLILPYLGFGRIWSLWRAWSLIRDENPLWILGKHKSPKRWGNQLRNRNWSPEEITQAIKKGKQFPAPNKVNPGHSATRYEYKGRYVVRDDVSGEILQISGESFNPNDMSQ